MATINRYKLLQINFEVTTIIYCLGTNFANSFSFLKSESSYSYSILFVQFIQYY